MMANNIQCLKNALRQDIKIALSSMNIDEKLMQWNYVTEKLIQHPRYLIATRIGIYLSLPDEICTNAIISHAFSVGKMCFIPRYNSNSMQMVKMNGTEEQKTLPKTKWNIHQPDDDDIREEALQSGGLDIIIVPGRAFTKRGKRLGRGKGYYDWYLNDYCEKNGGQMPYLIGLAYVQQLVDELPATSHDVELNEVMYDDRNI